MGMIRQLLRAGWKRREPIFWVVLVGFAVSMQWPMLKGWYYRTTGAAVPATTISWRKDLPSALAEAREKRDLVLVDFSASWCPPCIAMKHDVWPSPDVAAAVAAAYVPVVIDVDHDNGLSGRYDVPGIPAVLVLDANGRVVRRHDGYLPLDGMLQFLAAQRSN
jgi:thiol:disulfide interchange protein